MIIKLSLKGAYNVCTMPTYDSTLYQLSYGGRLASKDYLYMALLRGAFLLYLKKSAAPQLVLIARP